MSNATTQIIISGQDKFSPVAQSAADKFRDQMRRIETDAVAMTRQFNVFGSSVASLAGMIPVVGAAIAGISLTETISESALLAARYETLGAVMGVVGQNAGYTRQEMGSFAAALQKNGISMTESRSTLAQMAQAHIDLANATKLGRIAQDAAVIGNKNSSQAFADLIHGIQSAQIDVLRTIGINVNFEQSYDKLAKTMGKTTSQLTESEKTQARVNAVLEAGEKAAGAYAAAMDTAGKQLKSAERYAEDAKVKLGGLFQPAMITLAKLYTEALKGVNEQLDMLNKLKSASGPAIGSDEVQRRISETQKTIDEAKIFQEENSKPGTRKWQEYQSVIDASTRHLEELRDQLSLIGMTERNAARDASARAAIRAQEIKAEEDANAKLLAQGSKKTQAENALLAVKKDIAELSMSDNAFEQFKLSAEYEKMAKALGSANPELRQWLELKTKELALKQAAKLEPYQVTQLERMNQGDMFWGKASADKRGQAMLDDVYQHNGQLITEFSEKFRALTLGDTEFQIAQLEEQAREYHRAGVDEVALAQWVADEKMRISRDWLDGAKRSLEDYATTATDAAASTESFVTDTMGAFKAGLKQGIQDWNSWGDAAIGVLENVGNKLLDMALDQATGAMAQSLLGMFTGAGSTASVMPSGGAGLYYSRGHHGGGIVGSGEESFIRPVPAAAFANAPRFHNGFMPDEYAAILKKDEGVFTPGQMRALGSGGNVTVNVIESPGGGGRQEQRTGPGGERIIDVFVERVKSSIASDIVTGNGLIPAAGKKMYGWNRANGALK